MVKKIISVISLLLVLSVFGMTIYKLVIKHNNRLYDVLYSEIEYQAKRCYLEEKCESNVILNELYNKGYLKIQFDPISKEELDKNLEIKLVGEEFEVSIRHK